MQLVGPAGHEPLGHAVARVDLLAVAAWGRHRRRQVAVVAVGVQLLAPREDPPPAPLLVAEAGEEGLVGLRGRRRPGGLHLPGGGGHLLRRHGDDGRRGREDGGQEKQAEATRGLHNWRSSSRSISL